MDEEEFDSLMGSRPFRTEDAIRADAQLRRRITLGVTLRGQTTDDMQRQPLAPYPEMHSGFNLADFRELQRSAQVMYGALFL